MQSIIRTGAAAARNNNKNIHNKMVFSMIFGNNNNALMNRLDAMRNAEQQLMLFARRFIPMELQENEEVVDIQLMDTEIPKHRIFGDDAIKKSTTTTCQISINDDHNNKEDDSQLIIHGVKVTSTSNNNSTTSTTPLILLHGYANAALYFYRNLSGLSRQHYGTVYALDMLGWGLSSRPPFVTEENTVRSAEKFFVESIEAWREANGLEKMILGGHSMGGYLSVAYAEKYPERVEKLILISPVGVPHVDEEKEKQKWTNLPLRYRLMFGTVRTIWKMGTTPGSFIRFLSESRARGLVEGYVDRRLPAIEDPEEKTALSEYLFTNSMLPGSGEYILNRVLKPGAYARDALVHRIPKLKVSSISFLYGRHDWMDLSGGLEVQKLCEAITRDGGEAPSVEVHEVDKAGHLLMLENWYEFNSAMVLSGGGKIHPNAPRPRLLHFSQFSDMNAKDPA